MAGRRWWTLSAVALLYASLVNRGSGVGCTGVRPGPPSRVDELRMLLCLHCDGYLGTGCGSAWCCGTVASLSSRTFCFGSNPERCSSSCCCFMAAVFLMQSVGARLGGSSDFVLFFATQGDRCPRGEMCPFAHNVFECWLHPTR